MGSQKALQKIKSKLNPKQNEKTRKSYQRDCQEIRDNY